MIPHATVTNLKDVSAILNEIKNIVDKQLEHTNCKSSMGDDYLCYEFVMDNLQHNFRLFFIYQCDNTVLVSIGIGFTNNIIEISDPMFFQNISASVRPVIEEYVNSTNKEMEAIMNERREVIRALQT